MVKAQLDVVEEVNTFLSFFSTSKELGRPYLPIVSVQDCILRELMSPIATSGAHLYASLPL